MKKNKSLFVLLALCFSAIWADAQVSLSFEESLRLLRQENQSLKIADKSIEIAKAERDKLNAFWYPSLQSAGAFVHMSEKIEVKQPLSQFTDPAKNFVHSIIPDDQVISAILDQIGANTLVFPLTPRNLTSIDLSAEWVLFSGGKRFHATNIGRTMVDLARENRAQTAATQQNLLTESYYGLRLAQQIVTVREENQLPFFLCFFMAILLNIYKNAFINCGNYVIIFCSVMGTCHSLLSQKFDYLGGI